MENKTKKKQDEHYMETSQGIMRELGFLDSYNELNAPRSVYLMIT